MTDIVYIVGNGSRWDDNELRFSLRSIAKYGKNIGRVIIVGNCPKWVNRDQVIHVDAQDRGGCKHINIACKILAAIETLGLKKKFLISSDDHIYTRPVDFNKYPIYSRGEMQPGCENLYSDYHRSMTETRKWLIARGLPIQRTNPHFNTWIEPSLLPAMVQEILDAHTMDGIEINCYMGNTLISKRKKFVHQPDCKINRPHTVSEWQRLYEKNHCISLGDNGITTETVKFLLDRFPEPSIYETDNPTMIDLVNPRGRRALHFRLDRNLIRRRF